jgi:hypothetical protein
MGGDWLSLGAFCIQLDRLFVISWPQFALVKKAIR